MTDTEKQVDDILVKLWNDLSNRNANQILFKDAMDIMQARTEILQLIKNVDLTTPDGEAKG